MIKNGYLQYSFDIYGDVYSSISRLCQANDEIRLNLESFVKSVMQMHIKHVGINCIHKLILSTTMSPGLEISMNSLNISI